jgi:transcriptional regulator
VAWAKAFADLLEARGVKTGSGARNDATSTMNVEVVAKEAGVHPNTARNRLRLAEDLEPYPETAAKVDRGEVSMFA